MTWHRAYHLVPMSRLVAIAALLLFLVACKGGPPANSGGAEVFSQVCATCHSADLSGGIGPALGPGSNAAGRTDEFLITTITHGRGRMPSFRTTLSEQQILDVVAYIREVQSG